MTLWSLRTLTNYCYFYKKSEKLNPMYQMGAVRGALSVPRALCPVPCALCPVPCALCPVPCALI